MWSFSFLFCHHSVRLSDMLSVTLLSIKFCSADQKCFCAKKVNASNSQCSGFIHVYKKHANMLTNRISSAVMSCFSQTASCFFNTPLIYSSPVYNPSPPLRPQTETNLQLRQTHEGPCFFSLSINFLLSHFLVLHDGNASVDHPDGKMWHHCSVLCSATASNYPVNTVYTQAAHSPACAEWSAPRPI